MNNIDKEIVIEDLEFIADYIGQLVDKYPEIANNDADIIKKISRRMNDISKRVEG